MKGEVVRLLFVLQTAVLAVSFFSTAEAEVDLPRSVVADENPFRTAKMNFVWSKAVYHMTDKSVLKRVKKELERFDGLYLSAKERSLKTGRNDLHEVDRKLEEAMKKFNLDGVVAAHHQKIKWKGDESHRMENTVLGAERFQDAKLDKLWQAALTSRFTDFQIKNLRKELKDYEKKEENYHNLLDEFRKHSSENAIDGHESEDRDVLNQKLKNLSRELTESYNKLHEKIFGMAASAFRNEEVDALWRMAVLDSNYTETELETIRLELAHFDKQMNKLQFHEQELEATKEALKQHGKADIVEENLSEFEADFVRLKRKLKKLEKHLQSRIRHTEL